MSTTIDQKVVEMRFDNKQFEAGVRQSLSTLDRLKTGLNLEGAAKGLERVSDAANKCDMSKLGSAVETVRARFSSLEVMAVTALANITNSAVNAGKQLLSSFTIQPITTGFDEYELKMGSIQTIMASTGESLDRVNQKLDELNAYSDRTIYSFADMTQNIGKFTNAGVNLDDAVAAIQGVANVAAVSGANANEASRAMYNFGQALSSGSVRLIDWKSIELANMATVEFKEQLIETALELGTLVKVGDKYQSTTTDLNGKVSDLFTTTTMFNDSLSSQWMTTEVLTATLGKYADETTEIGKKAFAAAQDVKTFSQLMDTLRESVQSGWAETFQLILGDFEEAKAMWTVVSQVIGGALSASSEARNSVLRDWKELGGRTAMLDTVAHAFENLTAVIRPVRDAFRDIFPPVTGERLYALTTGLRDFVSTLKISEDTANQLQRTCAGLFAVFDIVGTVAGGVLYNGLKALGQVLSGLDLGFLDLTAALGDGLVRLRDWIDEHNIFVKGINAMATGIKSAITAMREWTEQFFSLPQVQRNLDRFRQAFVDTFANFNEYFEGGKERIAEFLERVKSLDGLSLENAKAALIDFRDNVIGYFLNFDGVFDSLKRAVGAFGDDVNAALERVKNGAANSFDQMVQFMVNLRDNLFRIATEIRTKLADKIGFGEIFAIGVGTALVVFVKKISDALSTLAAPFEGIGDVLKSASKALNSFAMETKSKALLNAAKAILILVGALAVLTLLDQERLLGAVAILGLLAAGLVGLSFAISKMGDTRSLVKLSASLLSVGASLLLLATALKQLESLGAGDAVGGLAILAALAAGLVAVAKLLGTTKKTFFGGSMFLISFTLALKLLVGVLEDIAGLDLSGAGKTVGLLFGIVAALALVSAACRNVNLGAAVTLVAIVVSLKLLAGCLDDLALVDMAKARSNMSAFIAVFGMFAVLMAASKFAGEHASKAGSAIFKMSAGLLLIAAAIKMLDGIDPLTLERTADVIAKLMLVFGAVTALSHFAGKNAAKAGTMLLAMSGALLILSTAMVVLANLDASGLQQALEAVVALELVFGALIGITYFAKYAKDVTKTLTVLTVALAAMVAAVAGLSMMNPEQLQNATAALTVLMSAFALLVASTHLAKKAQGVLVVMTLVVGALAGILTAMSVLNVQAATQNAAALGILLTSLSASLTILSKAAPIAPTAYGGIAAMLVVAAGVAALLGIMDALDVKASLESAASISLLLMAMSGACLILGGVGATGPAAFIGIGALATLVAAIGGIMAAISALTANNPTIEADLDRAIMVMEKIGTGLGAALGGFVGGVLGGLTAGLPIIGANLSDFMTNAQPFFDQVKGLDAGAMDGVKVLAETLLILTGANILEGLTSWLTGGTSLSAFGEGLPAFGKAIHDFSDAVTGIDGEAVSCAANAGKVLAEMAASLPNSGGVLGFFAGENDMGVFSDQIVEFGEAMVDFSNAIEGMKPDAVINAANAGKAMAEMARTLPNSGGVLGFFAGENDMEDFAAQLVPFGEALKNYSLAVTGLEADVVTNSATAGKAMVELANTLPNSGGVIGFLLGENDLDTFGTKLVSFGNSIKNYSMAVAGLNVEAVTKSAAAGQVMVELANTIPNCGGLVSFFTGGNNIADFGDDLVLFGNDLAAYSTAIAGVQPDAVTASANAAQALSNLAAGLPDSSLFDQWFGGDQTLASFGSDIASFGASMNVYYSYISGVDIGKLSGVIAQVWRLVELAEGTQGLDTSGFTGFSSSLRTMAEAGLDSFTAAFQNSEARVNGAVSGMLDVVVSTIQTRMPETTAAMTNLVNGLTGAVRLKTPDMTLAATVLVQAMGIAIVNGRGQVVSAAVVLVSSGAAGIISQGQLWTNAATTLVDKFIEGIRNNVTRAAQEAAAMAAAAYAAAMSEFDGRGSGGGISITTVAGGPGGAVAYSGSVRRVMNMDDMVASVRSGGIAAPAAFRLSPMGSLNRAASVAASSAQRSTPVSGTRESTPRPTTVQNFTQNNYSPKSLDRTTIYRNTKNLFSQLKGG